MIFIMLSPSSGLVNYLIRMAAGKLLWIVSIDIPVMVPTMTVLLILNSAGSCSTASTEPSCSRRR